MVTDDPTNGTAPDEAAAPMTPPESSAPAAFEPAGVAAPSAPGDAVASEDDRGPVVRGPDRGPGGFGDRGRPDDRGRGGPPRRGGRPGPRRKVCIFCADHIETIDYKEVGRLRRYISELGKIEPRRKTGNCARHQRRLTLALKRARHLAMLPYTADHIRVTGASYGPQR